MIQRKGVDYVNGTEAQKIMEVSGVTFAAKRNEYGLKGEDFPGQRGIYYPRILINLIHDSFGDEKEEIKKQIAAFQRNLHQ